MSECPECNTPQPEDANFCDHCGCNLAEATTPTPSTEVAASPETPPGQSERTVEATEAEPPTLDDAAPLVCVDCGSALEPDSNFCDQCGHRVAPPSSSVGRTRRYSELPSHQTMGNHQQPPPHSFGQPPQQGFPPVPGSPQQAPFPHGPAHQPPSAPSYHGAPQFSQGIPGYLVVQGANIQIPFPPGRSEVYVGREDPLQGQFPEIDLTNYGADQGGVSRLHARIFMQGGQVMVMDNDSSNHTYVNDQRIYPGQPHPLNDGDEIQLGRVKLVYYV